MGTVFRESPSSALDSVRMGGLPRLVLAVKYLILGQKHEAIYQYQTGIDRICNAGDYAPGGNFDHMYPGWRIPETTHRQMLWKRATKVRKDTRETA